MRLLRGLVGALLWVVAGLLGLVGVLLCVTVILLPVGIPLVKVAGSLLRRAVQLMLPRALAHPVNEIGRAARKKGAKLDSAASGTLKDTTKSARRAARKIGKRVA